MQKTYCDVCEVLITDVAASPRVELSWFERDKEGDWEDEYQEMDVCKGCFKEEFEKFIKK